MIAGFGYWRRHRWSYRRVIFCRSCSVLRCLPSEISERAVPSEQVDSPGEAEVQDSRLTDFKADGDIHNGHADATLHDRALIHDGDGLGDDAINAKFRGGRGHRSSPKHAWAGEAATTLAERQRWSGCSHRVDAGLGVDLVRRLEASDTDLTSSADRNATGVI